MPRHRHVVRSISSRNVCAYGSSARNPRRRIQSGKDARNLQLSVSMVISCTYEVAVGRILIVFQKQSSDTNKSRKPFTNFELTCFLNVFFAVLHTLLLLVLVCKNHSKANQYYLSYNQGNVFPQELGNYSCPATCQNSCNSLLLVVVWFLCHTLDDLWQLLRRWRHCLSPKFWNLLTWCYNHLIHLECRIIFYFSYLQFFLRNTSRLTVTCHPIFFLLQKVQCHINQFLICG